MYNKTCLLFVLCSLYAIVLCQKCVEDKSPGYYYSSYSSSGVRLICTDIKDAFPNFTRIVKSIKCLNCSVSNLDRYTISNFSGDTFNLSFTHIQTIASMAFEQFINKMNIRTFLLNDNEISSIAANLFNNFSTLDEIVFRNNKIINTEEETFKNTNVSVLDLSMNKISKVDRMFRGLQVVKLNLSSNNIVDIPEDALDNTVFWPGRYKSATNQALDLSWNLIQNIRPNTFKAGSLDNRLSKLYLKGNKITKIENDTFSQLGYLYYLSLEENEITELNINSFRGLSKLNELVLKTNYIKEIPQGVFSNMLLLENLDLSSNHILILNEYIFSGLSQMKTLNISYNNLKTLTEMHLLPMGRLAKLDVSDNALKALNLRNVMEHHHMLRFLILNNNYWSCKNLVEMYKILNQRMGGFNLPSHYFNVPNLHGIACSRTDVQEYDYKNFEDFLNTIAQDQLFEDLYDSRLRNDVDVNTQYLMEVVKTINGIFYIVLLIMTMFMIIFLQFIARHVFDYLHSRKVLSDRFSLKYAQNQDTVALI